MADLEQITVNKIRGALQELFGVDLLTHKVRVAIPLYNLHLLTNSERH